MPDSFVREKIENWIGDFCGSDAIREYSGGACEFAPEMLTAFLTAARDLRGVAPEEIEEADVKHGLLHAARLSLPVSVKRALPALCGALLTQLELDGRLGGGRLLGTYARALSASVEEAATGKPKPIKRPGRKIGRNDPCPCGSGRKYKKCCMRG